MTVFPALSGGWAKSSPPFHFLLQCSPTSNAASMRTAFTSAEAVATRERDTAPAHETPSSFLNSTPAVSPLSYSDP